MRQKFFLMSLKVQEFVLETSSVLQSTLQGKAPTIQQSLLSEYLSKNSLLTQVREMNSLCRFQDDGYFAVFIEDLI